MEQAGGMALEGSGKPILDVQPGAVHQRIPFLAGGTTEMNLLSEFISGSRTSGS